MLPPGAPPPPNVLGPTLNPLHCGIGPFQKLYEDKQWITAIRFILKQQGASQFFVNMLHIMREAYKDLDKNRMAGASLNLRVGKSASKGSAPHEQKEATIRKTVERYLPELAKSIQAKEFDYLGVHQDAFAAGYDLDELILLGATIKYAGMHELMTVIQGKNGFLSPKEQREYQKAHPIYDPDYQVQTFLGRA